MMTDKLPLSKGLGELADATKSQGSTAPDPDAGGRVPIDCGDLLIRIARNGTWFYRGTPILRPALVKLFSTVLRREADGTYWMVTPAERGRVTVEDAPFLAVELDVVGEGEAQELRFRTNVDDLVTADEAHPIRIVEDAETGEPNPYILIRNGLEARLTRPVFYALVNQGREERVGDSTQYGVWSKGKFFLLGIIASA